MPACCVFKYRRNNGIGKRGKAQPRCFRRGLFFRRQADELYVPPLDLDHPFVAHPLEFAHHRAAVDADIVRKARLRKGQGKVQALVLCRQHGKVRRQLLARRAAAQNFEVFGERLRLFAHQLHEVGNDRAVMRARFGAALHDVFVVDEQYGAVLFRQQKKSVVRPVSNFRR